MNTETGTLKYLCLLELAKSPQAWNNKIRDAHFIHSGLIWLFLTLLQLTLWCEQHLFLWVILPNLWILCLVLSVFFAPITGSFGKGFMSPRNKLAKTMSLLSLSVSLPLLFLLYYIVFLCWVKNGHCQRCVVTFARGPGDRNFIFVCVCPVSWIVSGRGEISAGKSLEAFYSTQQMAISREPTSEQKFRIICLTPCSYANS